MEFFTHIAQAGNKIICRGYRNGKRFREEVNYNPYLFLPTPHESDYHTIDGKPVGKVEFESMREARSFIERYDTMGSTYYGSTYFTYTYLNDRFPGRIEFDPELINVVSLDIEVASPDGFPNLETADQPITAITLTKKGKAITFGMKSYTPKSENHHYFQGKDEAELLMVFLEVWSKNKLWMPDIVTGWSIEEFDIPYIIRRIIRILGEEWVIKLSPNKYVSTREKVLGKTARREARKITVYDLSGLAILDYIQLYERYTKTTQESYSLKNIAHVEEIGEKMEFEGTLEELYENNFETFIDYNLNDAFLVEQLEAKCNFIQLVLRIAYRAKINYTDALTTARPWDIIIHNHLMDKKIVVPQNKEAEDTGKIKGAFVKEVVPGMYKWVVSVDFDSLYPRLISQQNISNDTLVDVVPVPNINDWLEGIGAQEIGEAGASTTVCANGSRYIKHVRGFIPELVDQFIDERVEANKENDATKKLQDDKYTVQIGHLNSFQESWKILTNGLYGALAMRYFRWYDIRLAEAVTMTGQLAVRWVLNEINRFLNQTLKTEKDYIIAADTDSCYICLDALVSHIYPPGSSYTTEDKITFIDRCMKEKIEPLIEKTCNEICKQLNAYNPKLHMKREAICDKTVWRAKKNYILNVWDDEGVRYKEAKIKMKGIEAIRASTPIACRDQIKKAIKILMNNEEKDLHVHVAEFKKIFMKLPFEQVAFPRTVNGIHKYWDADNKCFRPKTPPNVRGSVTYNNLLKDKSLTGKYHIIRDRDKIKWAWLKVPNPFHSTCLAVFDTLPSEFDIQEYIDYNMQFEKTFRHPVETIIQTVGWKTEPSATLNKFFKKKEPVG